MAGLVALRALLVCIRPLLHSRAAQMLLAPLFVYFIWATYGAIRERTHPAPNWLPPSPLHIKRAVGDSDGLLGVWVLGRPRNLCGVPYTRWSAPCQNPVVSDFSSACWADAPNCSFGKRSFYR